MRLFNLRHLGLAVVAAATLLVGASTASADGRYDGRTSVSVGVFGRDGGFALRFGDPGYRRAPVYVAAPCNTCDSCDRVRDCDRGCDRDCRYEGRVAYGYAPAYRYAPGYGRYDSRWGRDRDDGWFLGGDRRWHYDRRFDRHERYDRDRDGDRDDWRRRP